MVLSSIALAAAMFTPVGDETRVSIPGSVVTASGERQAGVEVLVSRLRCNRREVYSRLRTDEDGRFQLDLPERFSGFLRQNPVLHVHRHGYSLGHAELAMFIPPEGWPLSIVLAPETESPMQILAPDGTPIEGARIVPSYVGREHCLGVPDELAERLAVVTGADGRACQPAVAAEDLATFWVETEVFGRQRIRHDVAYEPRRCVTLSPVGHVTGKLLADDSAVAARRKVLLTTNPPTVRGFAMRMGEATVETDAEGRFEAVLMAGSLTVEVAPTEEQPFGASADGYQVEVGKTTELEVTLKRSLRVQGEVIERASGRPLEDVEVQVSQGIPQYVATDAAGRYAGWTLGRRVAVRVNRLPPPFLLTPKLAQEARAEGLGPTVLPRIEVERGARLGGRVLDEEGKPVAGAWVTAREDSKGFSWPIHAITDASGAFTIEGLSESGPVEIDAALREARLKQKLQAEPEERKDLELRLTSGGTVLLSGRVVDAASKPVPRARVALWRRYEHGELVRRERLFEIQGLPPLFTDKQGGYTASRPVEHSGEYCAMARRRCLISWCARFAPSKGMCLMRAGNQWLEHGSSVVPTGCATLSRPTKRAISVSRGSKEIPSSCSSTRPGFDSRGCAFRLLARASNASSFA
ncbi:MAG: carboxypeptidase regulatory-like domain-containing protein [Planctomycetota bacterium]